MLFPPLRISTRLRCFNYSFIVCYAVPIYARACIRMCNGVIIVSLLVFTRLYRLSSHLYHL